MTPEEARERVLAEVEPERRRAESALKTATKLLPKVHKDAAKASDRWWALVRKNGLDDPITVKEKAAAHAHDSAARQLRSVEAGITAAKRKLVELTSEVAIEKRVAEKLRTHGRVEHLKSTKRKGKMATATSTRTSKKIEDVPKSVSDKIVKLYCDKGLGTPPITKQLNDEKAEPHGKEWTDAKVRGILTGTTGKTLTELRKKAPAASRALSDREPAPTRRVTRNGNGNGHTATAGKKNGGNGSQVKPLSKKAQAAGTSRGGTGKKKKTAAKKRGAARKS